MASIYKALGIQYGGIDDYTLTVIGAIGGLSNGFSRVMWGFLQDRVGFKPLYSFILIVQLVIALTITTVVHNRLVYGIWILIGYACLGAHFVLFPTVILKVFGIKSGA